MTYAIWHGESGNIVSTYKTEAEALQDLRDALRAHGEPYVEALALLRESAGRTKLIAQGRDLVKRAKASDRQSASTRKDVVPA